jgi:ABC-type uncharacterized transport system involved in gliding motility auxiliary subunit
LGLLLVLTSPVTLFVTSGSGLIFGAKLGLGMALLAFWSVTNGERLSNWARSVFFYSSSVLLGLAFILFLLAANYLAQRSNKTWDLTRKKIYSLSDQTQKTLEHLPSGIKAIAFVEGPVPEGVDELFKKYQSLNPKFTFEFLDPRRAPDLTQKYQIRQGQPTAILIQQASGSSHENQTTINLLRLSNPQLAEQELTNGIIKVTSAGQQKLYVLRGHGEWPLDPQTPGDEGVAASMADMARTLQDEGYAPEAFNLAEKPEIPTDAAALLIAGARSALSAGEVKTLERYLESGGRLALFVEPNTEIGLTNMLSSFGIQIDRGMVADSRVNPEQPYVVVAPFYSEHEIVKLLAKARANVVLPTVASLALLKDVPGVAAVPLVLSSPYAWVDKTISQKPEFDSGEKGGQITLAAVSTRDTSQVQSKRADEARLVVFGDSDLVAAGFGIEPNRNLVMNSIAYLTQQTQKITIRPPDRDFSTLELTEERLSIIRLLAMDVLPLMLMGVGLTMWLSRRAR